MNNNKKAIIAGIAGNSIFGFSFLFSTIGLRYAEPPVLLALRFDVAFLGLLILAVLRVIKLDLKGKNLKGLLLMGTLQPIVYFLCENYGLQHASSSIAGVIIALVPVAAFFTGFVILKERFAPGQLLWVFLSILGVSMISMAGKSEGNLEMIGLVLLFGAVLAAAVYNAVSRSIAEEFSPTERTFMMFFLGAVFFTGLSVIMTKGAFFSLAFEALSHPDFTGAVIYLGVVSSILAFYLLNYAVSYLPVRQAASFTSLTSVISVAAGLIFLREKVSLVQVVGIVMILTGVYKVNTTTEG